MGERNGRVSPTAPGCLLLRRRVALVGFCIHSRAALVRGPWFLSLVSYLCRVSTGLGAGFALLIVWTALVSPGEVDSRSTTGTGGAMEARRRHPVWHTFDTPSGRGGCVCYLPFTPKCRSDPEGIYGVNRVFCCTLHFCCALTIENRLG